MWPFFLIGSWSLQSGPGSNLLDSTLVVSFMSYMTVVGLTRAEVEETTISGLPADQQMLPWGHVIGR